MTEEKTPCMIYHVTNKNMSLRLERNASVVMSKVSEWEVGDERDRSAGGVRCFNRNINFD